MAKQSDADEPLWRHSGQAYLPLSVAAAAAFHAVHHGTKAIANRNDYNDALNIAATTLARLIPIYVVEDPRKGREAVNVDPTADSFTRGATRLRRRDGTLVSDMSVLGSDLRSAVAQLRSAGLPLFLAGAAGPSELASAPLSPKANRLLAALPEEDYEDLRAGLEFVPLRAEELLYTEHAELRYVHFPISGVVSILYITEDGEPTEIAIIGNEGIVGLAVLLGSSSTPRRAVVQIEGHAYRMKAETILEHFRRGGALQALLLRYVQSLMNQMAQTAVCNRHHTIEQQLCRWLLLSLDRTSSNEVLMTQELISQMLGVRRSGISEAAKKLQDLGFIDYRRGRIVVLKRKKLEAHACECYGIVKREGERLLSALGTS